MSKRLGGIIGNTSSWHLNEFPDGSNIGQQYNDGEKPTVILYVCMYVCMYVCIFIKLHITAQSGLVILVILCHSR